MGSFRKRRRRRNLAAPESLDEVLERAGENRFAKKQLPIPLARWRTAVGPRIADRARPLALERGVLLVKVATSVWANELSMLAPQIIAKLAPAYDVKSLRFRVGPLDVIEGIPTVRDYRRIPPPVPLAADLAVSLATVEDVDLRGIIEKAARQNLAWQTLPPPGPDDSSGACCGDRSACISGACSFCRPRRTASTPAGSALRATSDLQAPRSPRRGAR